MKKILLPALFAGLTMASCSGEQEQTEEKHVEETTEVVEEVIEEIVEDAAPTVGEFILGTWAKIAQGCDENGNNCEETPDASDWVFTTDSVSLGNIAQPYEVVEDTILIAGSPYMISSEMGDTIILHGLNANRFMKMVKK